MDELTAKKLTTKSNHLTNHVMNFKLKIKLTLVLKIFLTDRRRAAGQGLAPGDVAVVRGFLRGLTEGLDEGRRRRRRFLHEPYFLYHFAYFVSQNAEEAQLGEGDDADAEDEEEVRGFSHPSQEELFAAVGVGLLADFARVGARWATRLWPARPEVAGAGHATAREVLLQSVPLFAEARVFVVVHLWEDRKDVLLLFTCVRSTSGVIVEGIIIFGRILRIFYLFLLIRCKIFFL